ncbi:MAG: response regulator [Alicyclobacillus sp.]|nr:response regulator [Alicyclobacillus sp.]
MKPSDISILYLDDESHNLVSFRAMFRRTFQIYTASSAHEAVQLLRAHDIPIVLTDQRMPDMTGVQFLEAILPEFPDTVRMIVTGFSDVESVVHAINNGHVYRYITKPWDEQELRVTLHRAADLVRLQRQNQRLLDELQQKVAYQERVMKLFQKYVPEHVLRGVLEGEGEHDLFKGESRIVSVLMSDIRDFTRLSAAMDPKDVVRFLNDYFSVMTACVRRHHGTVNKFIGDGLMAMFGAPVSHLGNHLNAVLCALDMVEQVNAWNDTPDRPLAGSLTVGIGINTGEVVVGNIGSADRVEYTAIGDTVNVASRLERLTKGHDNAIFISERTYQAVADQVLTADCGPLEIRGKASPMAVYQVVGRRDP